MRIEQIISLMRIAGYHDDKAKFMRLYIEHRIAFAKAQSAFNEGRRLKQNGMRCTCHECNPPK